MFHLGLGAYTGPLASRQRRTMTLESSLEENQRHVTGIVTCDLRNQGRNETLAQIDRAIKFVTKGPWCVCVIKWHLLFWRLGTSQA